MVTNEQRESLERRAKDHGRAAGSWVFDGNTDHDTIRRTLQGLEDGDPAVYDALPLSPDFSGQWADDPTWEDVLRDEGIDPDDDPADTLFTDYEVTYAEACEAEIVRSGRAMLPDSDDD